MNTNSRGIQAVRANLTPQAVLADLQNAFSEFKERQDDKLSGVQAQVANLEMVVSQGQFGTGGDPSHGGSSKAKSEHANAFFSWFRSGNDDGLARLEVQASLRTSSDPDGGYLVTDELDKEIEKFERDSSAIRQVARIKKISSATYKKIVSAGGTGSGWVGETSARPETSTPNLREIVINAQELYANPAVTQTLLDDNDFDVAGFLSEEIGDEFADQESDSFINGNGVGKPKGVLAYPASADPDATRATGTLQYVVSTHATAIPNADCLKKLKRSLRARYRQGACWVMNSDTAQAISLIKDTNGRYLWQDSLATGDPDTLLGYPVYEDENMPDIGAGTFPILFGNFQRGYTIVDRHGIRMMRDPYTNKPYVHFYTTKRVGGGVVNHQAIKLLKIAAS